MTGFRGLTQTKFLIILIAIYILAAVIFIFVPGGTLDLSAAFTGAAGLQMPAWQMAAGNAGIILVLYTSLGLLGLVMARRIGWPGIYRVQASGRDLFVRPLVLGVIVGLILVIVDLLVQRFSSFEGFPHPGFPASILASLSAGIGEEIMFRLFVMSLWAALLSWLSPRLLPGRQTDNAIFWIANLLGALAFAAGHLSTAMILMNVSTPAALPPIMLGELVVLNMLFGLVAGWVFRRDGLLAAVGVHFWADMIWHVLFGLVG